MGPALRRRATVCSATEGIPRPLRGACRGPEILGAENQNFMGPWQRVFFFQTVLVVTVVTTLV